MRVTRTIAVACLCSILVGGCAAGVPYETPTYVVRPQDTLYSIAWRNNLDYRELARWNGIGADYRVTVGQVLTLGPGRGARPAPPAPTAPRAPSPAEASRARPAAPSAPSGSGPLVGGNLGWTWPTDRKSAPVAVPTGGILLLGALGQDVRAAGAGRVVYTGSGIRGYGNLIIIKHGDALLSSYAHNREVLVREGEEVRMGQTIAHMGAGAHQIPALYFEIRVNGKPTDPLRYLR